METVFAEVYRLCVSDGVASDGPLQQVEACGSFWVL